MGGHRSGDEIVAARGVRRLPVVYPLRPAQAGGGGGAEPLRGPPRRERAARSSTRWMRSSSSPIGTPARPRGNGQQVVGNHGVHGAAEAVQVRARCSSPTTTPSGPDAASSRWVIRAKGSAPSSSSVTETVILEAGQVAEGARRRDLAHPALGRQRGATREDAGPASTVPSSPISSRPSSCQPPAIARNGMPCADQARSAGAIRARSSRTASWPVTGPLPMCTRCACGRQLAADFVVVR